MAGDRCCLFQRFNPGKTSENHENFSQDSSWVRVPKKAVPVARKLSTIEERRQDQSCLFRRGDHRIKDHNPGNLSWVRALVKMAFVSRKLGTTGEQCQD
jgi:hypothetical protein